MSIQRYSMNIHTNRSVPNLSGNWVEYSDHAAAMREARQIIQAYRDSSRCPLPCIACEAADKWLDAHKEFAPKEEQGQWV